MGTKKKKKLRVRPCKLCAYYRSASPIIGGRHRTDEDVCVDFFFPLKFLVLFRGMVLNRFGVFFLSRFLLVMIVRFFLKRELIVCPSCPAANSKTQAELTVFAPYIFLCVFGLKQWRIQGELGI